MELVKWIGSPSRASIGLIFGLALQGCGKGRSGAVDTNLPAGVDAPADAVQSEDLRGGTPQVAALWETAQPKAGKAWTDHAFQVVQTYGASLKAGPQDVTTFCPSYYSLSEEQKVSFWVYFVSAITKYESGFDPLSRMREPGLGTDPVTGQHVSSEVLLQLSYQDSRNYSFCNVLDWNADRHLSPNDPRKTILDPFKNLSCGIRILDRQVQRHHLIAFGTGNYWSTLKPNGSHGQVAAIKALTHQILFCR